MKRAIPGQFKAPQEILTTSLHTGPIWAQQITKLEIPTGNPLFLNINEKLEISECKYLDQERAKDLLVF